MLLGCDKSLDYQGVIRLEFLRLQEKVLKARTIQDTCKKLVEVKTIERVCEF